MSTTDNAVDPSRLLFSAGRLVAAPDQEELYRRLRSIIGAFLQVKNLNVLLGAGCSYELGSPRIRTMSSADIESMATASKVELTDITRDLVTAIANASGGTVDLERLLAALSSALSLAWLTGGRVHIAGQDIDADDGRAARDQLNRALARDCELPHLDRVKSEDLRTDPLRMHRTFFRRLMRARRSDLPRVRVFTLNYDLLIEKTLDADGVSYFDGFAGTVERVFRPDSFEQDLYLPPEPDRRRLLRVPDVLYLYKLHGSVNWRIRETGGTREVVQVREDDGDASAVIFPTPLKEGDVLAYPYSALLRYFTSSINQADSALLVIGYGFADDHVNRLIAQALGNPSFQIFAAAPGGVVASITDEGEVTFEEGPFGTLGKSEDARITVLTGEVAGTFGDIAENSLPDLGEANLEPMTKTQSDFSAAIG